MKAVIFALDGTLLAAKNDTYELHEHAEELLTILKRLGLRLLAHTDATDPAAQHLVRTGLHRHFSAFTGQPNASQTRMHPGQLWQVLAELGVTPAETVLVSDGVADMYAGKNAGLAKVVAVSYGFGAPADLREAGADHIIDDIPSLLDVLE